MSHASLATPEYEIERLLAWRSECPDCGTRDGLKMLTGAQAADLVDDGVEDFYVIEGPGLRHLWIKWCTVGHHVLPPYFRKATPVEIARITAAAPLADVAIIQRLPI